MRTLIAAGLAVVLLAGCSGPGQENAPSAPPLVSVSQTPSETPSETPSVTPSSTSKLAETLCVRMDATLVKSTLAVPVANIHPETPPADFGVPTYDVCQLTLSKAPNGPVLNVETSVLQATKATLAATQKAYAATKKEPAKPALLGEGGYGTSSFVVFLLDGKLYKIAGPKATLAKYIVLGQEAIRQVPGLPAADLLITRPDCERGSDAAEKVLGVPASARRDGQTALGDPVCGWVTPTGALYSSARRTTQAAALMVPIRKAATSQPIPLGDEGYVDTATGRTTIRVGDDKLVDLVPLPARAINPDLMTQFALAMSSLYTR
ncbi:hypothetical protein [Kribbella jiaozuonensis]|uniref:DUF3558 domain-containing protein n=1 Tax=Kribbella jiaozuonensis TaxID=2575441 RepID=A0A4U3M0Q5_9ACTN|nr:hypothetical protein [Kribbella jiaozuonensis]TKK81509.1 hypothetical protein FDA38_01250 [Kribbella jiaozuonensis]